MNKRAFKNILRIFLPENVIEFFKNKIIKIVSFFHSYKVDEGIAEMMLPVYKKIDSENSQESDTTIPKILFQTFFDKQRIPNKVHQNIDKYASEYTRYIYDDNDAEKFLLEHYGIFVANKFRNIKLGAHKADLLRYCWLYKNGGVYMDIKTELLAPLKDILSEGNGLYTVISMIENTIHQAFIATPPKNPIFKKLINKLLSTSNLELFVDYLEITKQFNKILLDELGEKNLKAKKYSNTPYNCILMYEVSESHLHKGSKCGKHPWLCGGIYDIYNNKVINTRYLDYRSW